MAAVGNRYSGIGKGLLRIWGSGLRRGVAEKVGRGWWTRDANARRVTSARCCRRAASIVLRTAPSDQLQKPISRPPDVLIRTGNPSVIESETSRICRESKSQDARRAAGTITRFSVMAGTCVARPSTTLEPPTPQTADWSRVDEPTRRRASGSADILRDTAEAGDASGDHRVRHGASSSMRYEPLGWIATAECLLGRAWMLRRIASAEPRSGYRVARRMAARERAVRMARVRVAMS